MVSLSSSDRIFLMQPTLDVPFVAVIRQTDKKDLNQKERIGQGDEQKMNSKTAQYLAAGGGSNPLCTAPVPELVEALGSPRPASVDPIPHNPSLLQTEYETIMSLPVKIKKSMADSKVDSTHSSVCKEARLQHLRHGVGSAGGRIKV